MDILDDTKSCKVLHLHLSRIYVKKNGETFSLLRNFN